MRNRIQPLLKKAFTPITIMIIPHSNRKPLNLKIPSIGIFISIILWLIGTGYVFSIAIDTLEYYRMQDKLAYYSSQFTEMRQQCRRSKRPRQSSESCFL